MLRRSDEAAMCYPLGSKIVLVTELIYLSNGEEVWTLTEATRVDNRKYPWERKSAKTKMASDAAIAWAVDKGVELVLATYAKEVDKRAYA